MFYHYSRFALEMSLFNKLAVAFVLLGKILRIGLFVLFLGFLFQGTRSLAGYNRDQIILFYLTFSLIDFISQMLFREVYHFREYVIKGTLDLILVKPANALVRILLGGIDLLDFIVVCGISIFAIIFVHANFAPSPGSVALYLLLILNGLIIATAFHIVVVCIGIITASVDQLMFIYRDVSSMGRIPVDLYVEPIRAILTFILPLGIMVTFPAKALMNILSPELMIVSVLVAVGSFLLSIQFWHYSLKQYQSASS